MSAHSSAPSPGAIRNRRYRRRLREGLSLAYLEVPATIIVALIDDGRLAEEEAEDHETDLDPETGSTGGT